MSNFGITPFPAGPSPRTASNKSSKSKKEAANTPASFGIFSPEQVGEATEASFGTQAVPESSMQAAEILFQINNTPNGSLANTTTPPQPPNKNELGELYMEDGKLHGVILPSTFTNVPPPDKVDDSYCISVHQSDVWRVYVDRGIPVPKNYDGTIAIIYPKESIGAEAANLSYRNDSYIKGAYSKQKFADVLNTFYGFKMEVSMTGDFVTKTVVNSAGDAIGKGFDVINDGIDMVGDTVGNLTGLGRDAASGFFGFDPMKVLLYGGITVIGLMFLWAFLNPNQTYQLASQGISMGSNAAKVAMI